MAVLSSYPLSCLTFVGSCQVRLLGTPSGLLGEFDVEHGCYERHNPRDIGRLAPLTPFDLGVHFGKFRDNLADLSPFERCLYLRTEINAFGIEQQAEIDEPCPLLKFDELFSTDPGRLKCISDFLGLP